MSGFLALFPAAPPQLATNPLPTTPRSDAERFDLEWESQRLNNRFISRDTALFEAFEAGRDAYRQAGVNLENPYAGYWWRPLQIMDPVQRVTDDLTRQRRIDAWTEAHQRLAQGAPEEASRYLSVNELTQRARQRAATAARDAETAAAVGGGGLGAFAGSVGALFTDPVQLATLPFGAPWRAAGSIGMRVLETALIEAGIAAGTQAIVEAGAAPWRAETGAPGSIGQNIGYAAAGGAILGGGLRALAEGWGAMAGRAIRTAPPPAGSLAEHADDMALLAHAQIRSDLGNPAGPEGAAAHQATFDAAGQAAQQGQIAPVVTAQPQRMRVPQIAADPMDLTAVRDEVERMLTARGGSSTALNFGPISPELAARMPADLPDPITGFRLIMQSDEVRHAYRRHGPDGQSITVRPITADDLAQAPRWFMEADRYEFEGYSRQGLPIIRAERQLPDGTIAVVEEVRAGRETLAFKTLYFTRGGDGGAPGAANSGPGPAPRSPARPKREPGSAGTDVVPLMMRFNTYTPTGRGVLVEPQIMELGSLIPSHMDDGRPNPAFPHAEGVQPRDRSAAPSRDQVRAIAAGLIPERLMPNAEAGFGAPIVALDNVVESGNGRILALRTAFNDPALANQAAAYRAFLEAQGHDLTGFQQPVLVSRRISALSAEERRAFVLEANSRQTLAASATERATQDAGRLRQALELWRGGEVDSVQNAPFVRRFLGQLTEAERGDLLSANGHLTAEGIRRINDAMMAAAYGDVLGPLLRRFLETRNDGLRSVANALGDVSGDWARMRIAAERGEIAAGVDATADLGNALATLDHARRAKLGVRDLLLQSDLDRPPLTDAGAAFLAAMFRDPGFAGPQLGRERIAARLQGYIDEAMKTQGGPSLFGDAARPADVMAVGTRNADRAAAEAAPGAALPDQPALMAMEDSAPVFRFDAQPARRQAPAVDPQIVRRQQIAEASRAAEAERAAAPAPAVRSAEVLEAQRIAAREDIRVPEVPEGQLPTEGAPTVAARDLLDQAELRVTQASEAVACLIGAVA